MNGTLRWRLPFIMAVACALALAGVAIAPIHAAAAPTNVALAANGGAVTGFSHQFDSRARAKYVVDGKKMYNAYNVSWWVQNPSATESITVGFDSVYAINSVNIVNDGEYGARVATLYVSSDNVNWRKLGDWAGLDVTARKVDENLISFPPVQAKYLRLEFTQLNRSDWFQMCEIEVYGSLLPADPVRRLTLDALDQTLPDVFRDTVVFSDNRNGNWDIYSYDLKTGAEKRLTSDPATQTSPAVCGSTVVWEDWRNGNPDIYSYDLATGVERAPDDRCGERDQACGQRRQGGLLLSRQAAQIA